MEEIKELIRHYDLEEDEEHIIIPLPGKGGKIRKCYILKRNHIRIMYSEERYIDYPLSQVIEAVLLYPDMRLSEALYLIYKDLEIELPEMEKSANPHLMKENEHEKKNTD